jgi:hypothetical protein
VIGVAPVALCRQSTDINERDADVKRLNVLNVFGAHNPMPDGLSFTLGGCRSVTKARQLTE